MQAYVGQGANVTAGSLTVEADAKKQNASANSLVVSIGLLRGAGRQTSSTTSGTVEAFVGAETGTSAGSNPTKLNISGAVTVEAISQASPVLNVQVGAGGAIAGDGANATSTDDSTTRAYFGATTDVILAGSIAITATSLSLPSNTLSLGAGGLLAGSGASTTTTDESTTSAFLDNGVSITNSGTITIAATSNSGSQNNLSIGSGGVIQVGDAKAYAYLTETTQAYLGNNVSVTGSGDLSVTATATDADSASATVSGGGVFSGNFNSTQTSDSPTVQAYFGSSDTVNVAGNVAVTADSVSAEAHATAKAFGGGGIAVGIPDASASTEPTVTAYFGSSSTIQAGGNISLNSEEQSKATPMVQTFTNDIQDIYTNSDAVANTVPDSVVFPEHGLQTGDLVEYVGGSPAIQTPTGPLQSGRTYKVIAVDANTLQFGDIFQAGSISNGLDLFADSAGVDTSKGIINFGAPDYFQDGDAVQYFAVQGNSSIGLSTGTTYYVRPVSANAIELYTSSSAATTEALFYPSSIANNEIYLDSGSLSSGSPYTYLTDAGSTPNVPFLFQTNSVDVNTGDGSHDVGAHNIYVGQTNNFYVGEPVQYQYDGNGTPLYVDQSSGPALPLATGTTYYVVPEGNYIQLSTSYDNAFLYYIGFGGSVIPIDDTGTTTTAHALVSPPVSGLVNGATYYPEVQSDGGYELWTGSSYATISSFSPASLQELFPAGISLSSPAKPGSGKLVLEFTGSNVTSGITDQLYAPDGTSLYGVNPPSGSGQSSAIAEGGSGGIINVDEPTANLTDEAAVEAYDDAALTQAGDDVSITSENISNDYLDASNDGGGFISIQKSSATDSFENETAAYVGAGDPFVNGNVSADGVVIDAGGDFVLSADSQITADVKSSSDGGGSIADTEGTSTANDVSSSPGNATNAVVGSDAAITGKTVDIEASNSLANLDISASASGGGFAGGNTANTNAEITSLTYVYIGARATISGFSGVDVIAFNNNWDTGLHPDASGFYLFGGNSNNHNGDDTLNASVFAAYSATVIAGPRRRRHAIDAGFQSARLPGPVRRGHVRRQHFVPR